MDRQNNVKALVESSILCGVSIVIILMSTYIPFVMLIAFFILPGITTFIYVKHGKKYSIIYLTSVLIINIGISGPVMALNFMILWGFYGVALGYCVKSKRSLFSTIAILAAVTFLSLVLDIEIISFLTGTDIIAQGLNAVSQSYETSRLLYIKMGMSKTQVDQAIASLPSPKVIMSLLPAVLILASATSAFLGYVVIQKMLKRVKLNIEKIKPLSEWFIPSKISFGIILIFAISGILMITGYPNGENYFFNANIIFVYAFTINALAFVSAFLKKRKTIKLVSWVIIIFCLLPPIVNYLYFLGIFDFISDFRKLDKSRRKPIE
jgi:uncharacterized protein YybS (DUF2232 family)